MSVSRSPQEGYRRKTSGEGSHVLFFGNSDRSYLGPSEYNESRYAYLSRSGRPEVDRVRALLEEWLSRYPSGQQAELVSRLSSGRDVDFDSAFFELYLHELLLRLGASPSVHPRVSEASDLRADFAIVEVSGTQTLIEATVVGGRSKEERAAEARKNELYDVLNRTLDSPDFFVGVEIAGAPSKPVPARRVRQFLEEKLRTVSVVDCIKLLAEEGLAKLPRWRFDWSGWRIEFVPIPKSPETRGRKEIRPMGFESPEAHFIDDRTPIRDAIVGKATRYGDIEVPLVIAVNALGEFVDETSVLEALLGKEHIVVRQGADGMPLPPEPGRRRDGAWTASAGPRFTRVSAVLVAVQLSPWTVAAQTPTLYLNPWATRPYRGRLNALPHLEPVGGRFERRDGAAAAKLFSLSSDWPGEP